MTHRTQSVLLLVASFLAAQARISYAQSDVCTAPGNQFAPASVSDGAGGAIVIWSDYRSGDEIYAQHVLRAGVVDPAWTVDGILVGSVPPDGLGRMYEIGSDGGGGAFVTWLGSNGSGAYAQHVLTAGLIDPAWPADGILLGGGGPIISDGAGGAICGDGQHLLASGVVDPAWPANVGGTAVVSDGAGGAIFVAGTSARRVLASGVVAWTTGLGGGGRDPHIVADGAGGAIIAWLVCCRNGHPNFYYDIYARHVLASGSLDPAGTTNGSLLSGPDGATLIGVGPDLDASDRTMTADGSGGAFVTWVSWWSGNNVRAQHVLASGQRDPAWPANGAILCNGAVTPDARPKIVSDGSGGALGIWYSGAMHVLAAGSLDPAWPVCGSLAQDIHSTIVSDSSGGVIVISGAGDISCGCDGGIWALRATGAGGVAAVVPPRKGADFAVRAPHPNPTHAGATISLDLPTTQRVSVSIYDVSGHLVRTLAAEREFPAGSQNLAWDGTTNAGIAARAGVYLIRVTAGGASVARRVAILR